MKFDEYKKTVKKDCYRYTRESNFLSVLKSIAYIPGYRFMFLVRTAYYFKSKGSLCLFLYFMMRVLMNHYKFKYGIDIPYNTNIGVGFYIGHFGGIFINSKAILGCNCNINNDVTIGVTYGGKNPGVPKIGNNVYIGPGSKILGGIHIGNNVAIGANSVVIESVDDNAVVAGIPAKIISRNGSYNYVVNCAN
jgi:serine O-acetyltransferase